MSNRIALVITALLLVGCAKDAEQVTSAGNGFRVERLFTMDGCTVYRFTDAGGFRYFTNCSGSTSWGEGCGKGCTREVGINGGARQEK